MYMDGWALIHTLSSNNSTFQWGCCQMFWFWMRCGPSWLYCTFQQILLSVPRPLSGPYGAGVTLLPVDWRGFWQYLKYVFVFSIQQRKELAWNGFLFCLYAFWKAHIFLKKMHLCGCVDQVCLFWVKLTPACVGNNMAKRPNKSPKIHDQRTNTPPNFQRKVSM